MTNALDEMTVRTLLEQVALEYHRDFNHNTNTKSPPETTLVKVQDEAHPLDELWNDYDLQVLGTSRMLGYFKAREAIERAIREEATAALTEQLAYDAEYERTRAEAAEGAIKRAQDQITYALRHGLKVNRGDIEAIARALAPTPSEASDATRE